MASTPKTPRSPGKAKQSAEKSPATPSLIPAGNIIGSGLGGAAEPEAGVASDREERIRKAAHRIWEEEGRPEGQHDRHWSMARDAIERGE